MSLRHLYLKAASASLFSKVFTSFGALAVVWLLNDIAGKEGFGLIMIAFALNYILGTALASLLQSVLIYHVSREPDEHKAKVSACLFYGIGFGVLIALLEGLAAQSLASWMNKPDMSFWFSAFSWMVPAFAANSILASWYRARQDVPTMVLFFEVLPMAVRLVLLCIIAVAVMPYQWIGPVYVVSFALPFTVLYLRAPLKPHINPRIFTWWDISYGAKSMLSQLVNKSIRNITVFMLGFFTGAGVVAEFALATRFGQFLQMPKLILAQLQVPRMGAYLRQNKSEDLLREFDVMRMVSLAGTILGTAVFLIIAPVIFSWFGDYEAAYPLLLLLAVASIIRSGFGAVGGYVSIAGFAGHALVTNILTLIVLVISLYLFVPLFAGEGAAIALIIGALFSMGLMSLTMYRKGGLSTLTWASVFSMATSSAVLVLTVIGLVTYNIAAMALLLIMMGGLAMDRRVFEFIKSKKARQA